MTLLNRGAYQPRNPAQTLFFTFSESSGSNKIRRSGAETGAAVKEGMVGGDA